MTEQGVLYAPGTMDGKLFEERRRINRRSSGVIGPRDRHIDTFMQPAPGSRDTIRGRYSWREQRYRALDKWLIDRCRDAWLGQNGVQLRAAE